MITKQEASKRFTNLQSYMLAKQFADKNKLDFPDYEGSVKTEFKCRKNGDYTTVSIFGPMLYSDNGEEIVEKIQNIQTPKIKVQINSEGGELMAARAIANALNEHDAEVTTFNMGLAASAASVVFAAGDERIMGEGSVLMVHRAMSGFIVFGNRETMSEARNELDEMVELLDKLDNDLAKTYSKISNISVKQMTEYMNKETFFNSEESLDNGLATGVKEVRKKTSNKKQSNTIQAASEEAVSLLKNLFK